MRLNELVGLRLEDAVKWFKKMGISGYMFEVTKAPKERNKENETVDENGDFRVLRVTKENNNAVCVLLGEEK